MSADNGVFLIKVDYNGAVEYKVGESSYSIVGSLFENTEPLTIENMIMVMKEQLKDEWFHAFYSYSNAINCARQMNDESYTEYGIVETDYTLQELQEIIKEKRL